MREFLGVLALFLGVLTLFLGEESLRDEDGRKELLAVDRDMVFAMGFTSLVPRLSFSFSGGRGK